MSSANAFAQTQHETTAHYIHQLPQDNTTEFVFAGRSNCGKSSLINALCHHRQLARASQRPGKTTMLQCFRVNQQLRIIDVPGYGYASVSNRNQNHWAKLMNELLGKRENISLICSLVDIRHPNHKLDVQFIEWLEHYQRPYVIVLTKADKVNTSDKNSHIRLLNKTWPNLLHVFAVSCLTKIGIPHLREALMRVSQSDQGPF